MHNGVLLIDKPAGFTSRDIVNQVGKIFHTKKIGHTGTLDPMATGVLILCIGSYTKLVDNLTSKNKEYIAVMQLGLLTDTLDTTGKTLKEESVNLDEDKIYAAFKNFPREYNQEVPSYSAVKINGKKLYEYAREGISIHLPKRMVSIYSLEILSIDNNEVTFKTCVSKGTYIRSLIRDLGTSLKTYASMRSLRRVSQGAFAIDKCLKISDVTENTSLLTLDDLFSYPHFSLNDTEYQIVLNGNKLSLNSESLYLLLTYQNKTIALYIKDGDTYRIVFKDTN